MRLIVMLAGALALNLSFAMAASAKPDFNAATGSAAVKPLTAVPAELVAPGKPLHRDETFGVPSFLWANPKGAQAPVPKGKAASPREHATQAAQAHLGRYAGAYRMNRAAEAALETRDVQTLGAGPTIVRFRQRYDGIEVFRREVGVLMDRNLALTAISGYPSAHVASLGTQPFVMPATQAIASALAELTDITVDGAALQADGKHGEYTRYTLAHPSLHMSAPARARQVWFDLPEGLEPAWYVETSLDEKRSDGGRYAHVFSATDGRLLFRRNLTDHAAHSYRVWADPADGHFHDGPHGSVGTPHPTGTPDGYAAPFIAPALVTLDNLPFSRNDAWLPEGATETIGNNVDAYADLVSPDGFTAGDLRAPLSAPATFDYIYDTALAPDANATQRHAAITSLFYINNYLHDLFYDHGFDEAAGNAQHDNYGRGGLDGDSLMAEAQDYSGTNNANMSTPADGGRPRMQMYVWRGGSLQVTWWDGRTEAFTYAQAAFGPTVYNVSAPVVAARDTAGLTTLCVAADPTIVLTGKIALVDRGTCTFGLKVQNAEAAGAVGVLVVNSTDTVTGMSVDSTLPVQPTIPSMMIGVTHGGWLRSFSSNTVAMAADLGRDSALDGMVVAHEWGHYLSNRLINDAAGLANNQGRSMGEGWSDFVALLMTVEEADRVQPGNEQFNGVYPVSSYVTAAKAKGNHFYYGIRRYPYSTDMSKNPLTFGHVQEGVPLPNGVAVSANTSSNAEVHNAGEVWAVALWEVYAALLNDPRYTFAQARARMLDYTVAHLKLVPANPTFTEARDAMLAVAAATDVDDYALMWRAFAKRGLGLAAVAPPRFSTTHVGAVESFDAEGGFARASAAHVEFGLVSVDTLQTQSVDVSNIGTQPLTLTDINIGAHYHLGGTCVGGATLLPAASCSIDLTFAPTRHGVNRVQLIVDNDGAGGALVIPVEGEAISDSNRLVSQADPITIPTNGLATPFPSTLTVSGITAPVRRVELVLDGLSHTALADLIMVLKGPNGQGVTLMNGAGGGRPGVANAQLRFAADAAQEIPSDLPAPGLYRPASYSTKTLTSGPVGPWPTDLTIFEGQDPNGEWQLYVEDLEVNDGGTISGWRLLFTLANYTVSATAGAGGSITPATQTVNHGSATTFTVTPDTGYFTSSVSGCGGTLAGNTFTTGAVTADCSVTAQFAPMFTLEDGSGRPLGDTTVRAGDPLTIQVSNGSGTYQVIALPNAQGASGTLVDNGDGSWSFVPPKDGAFAGEYVITVTDGVTGSSHQVTLTVPLRITTNRPDLLSEGGSADIAVRGAQPGTSFTLDVVDAGNVSVNGTAATIAISATAVDDVTKGNPASTTLTAIDQAASVRVRVKATASGYPDGQSGLLTVIAADTFSGTVVDYASTAVNGATVAAKDLVDGLYQPYRAQTDVNGQFSLVAPTSVTQLLAAKPQVGHVSTAAAGCLSPCSLMLDVPGSDVLVARSGVASVNHTTQTIAASFANTPVIITGIPSYNGTSAGVARVNNVTTSGFGLRFQEWEYLNDAHVAETIPWLAIEPGRYHLPDGSIWEAGIINLSALGSLRARSFSAPFPGTPRLFLTVQSENEADAVTVRARGVTADGFKAALFEQESLMGSGHANEKVGYLAIYTPAQNGSVDIGGESLNYLLDGARIGNGFKGVFDGSIEVRLQEEQSLDSERMHKRENIDLLLLGTDRLFGQDVRVLERDTVTLRHR